MNKIFTQLKNFFKLHYLGTFLLLVGVLPLAYAQLHPVQITTQLVPPYSVYLSDYAAPGNEKLRLVMLQRDLTKPSYQVRLLMTIELNGQVVMRTSPLFKPAPINLEPGIPTVITGPTLQPYVDSRNIEFVGISREEYEQTKALPEGGYRICFTAYDYTRQDVAVSASGCSFFWLSKNEPPIINFPSCGTSVPIQSPQQIIFSWLPRNTTSPNSADETEYQFALYESRPANRNPNDVVLTSPPILLATTPNTQFIYDASQPLLFENMRYVWRVRAIDKSGRDQFRNNGYSEVCTFTYGGEASGLTIEAVQNLEVEGEAERRGKAWWTAQPGADGYKVFYKKHGSSHRWFSLQSDEASATIFDLEPDTEYEVRVQSYVGTVQGPFSDIKKFKTPPPRIHQCGDETPEVTPSAPPLPFATKGMIIDVQGIEMTLNSVQGPNSDGLYSGKGEVSIPYFGGAVFNVVFDNLFIDDTRTAVNGRIDFITKGVEEWIEEELEEQRQRELEELQEHNREQWEDTDFYEEVYYYHDMAIDSIYVDASGNVIITDSEGQTYSNSEIPAILANAPGKAIIIEDKNGDQWVVQSGGQVSEVPGGGLSPTYNIEVSEEALNIVKQALISLYNDYDEVTIQNLAVEVQQKQQTLDQHISEHNANIGLGGDMETEEREEVEFEPLFFDFELIEEPFGNERDDAFARLSLETKQKELEHNRGLFLRILGKSDNLDLTHELVAKELKINTLQVSAYVTEQKQAGKTDAEIIPSVKENIIELIDRLLLDPYLKKSIAE